MDGPKTYISGLFVVFSAQPLGLYPGSDSKTGSLLFAAKRSISERMKQHLTLMNHTQFLAVLKLERKRHKEQRCFTCNAPGCLCSAEPFMTQGLKHMCRTFSDLRSRKSICHVITVMKQIKSGCNDRLGVCYPDPGPRCVPGLKLQPCGNPRRSNIIQNEVISGPFVWTQKAGGLSSGK